MLNLPPLFDMAIKASKQGINQALFYLYSDLLKESIHFF